MRAQGVDDIAKQTRTTKRMLYYYFGSKEGLFVAVLERAYAAIRQAEQSVDIEHLDPVAAIRRLTELTFKDHVSDPEFIRLISLENIDRAEHMNEGRFADLNKLAIDRIAGILDAGRSARVFRTDVDAVDVHMLISAYCVFRVANLYTWRVLFGRDLLDAGLRDRYRRMLGDVVVGDLTADQ